MPYAILLYYKLLWVWKLIRACSLRGRALIAHLSSKERRRLTENSENLNVRVSNVCEKRTLLALARR